MSYSLVTAPKELIIASSCNGLALFLRIYIFTFCYAIWDQPLKWLFFEKIEQNIV